MIQPQQWHQTDNDVVMDHFRSPDIWHQRHQGGVGVEKAGTDPGSPS